MITYSVVCIYSIYIINIYIHFIHVCIHVYVKVKFRMYVYDTSTCLLPYGSSAEKVLPVVENATASAAKSAEGALANGIGEEDPEPRSASPSGM